MYEGEIREASGQLQPIKEQLSKAIEEKKDKDKFIEQYRSEMNNKLTNIRTKRDKLRELEAAVKRYFMIYYGYF